MWGPLFSLQVELGQPCCCPSLMMDSAGSARYPSPAQPLLGSPLKCSSCQNLQIFFFENTGLDYFYVVLLFLLCIPGEGCTCSSWLPAEPCTGSWLWKEPLSPLGKSAVPGASPASRGLPGPPGACRARGSPGGSGAEALGVLLRVALGGRRAGRTALCVRPGGSGGSGSWQGMGSSKGVECLKADPKEIPAAG